MLTSGDVEATVQLLAESGPQDMTEIPDWGAAHGFDTDAVVDAINWACSATGQDPDEIGELAQLVIHAATVGLVLGVELASRRVPDDALAALDFPTPADGDLI